MTRKQLLLLIFADVLVIVFSSFNAWTRFNVLRANQSYVEEENLLESGGATAAAVSVGSASVSEPPVPPAGETVGPTVLSTGSVPAAPPAPAVAAPPAPVKPELAKIRKIFTYDNGKAKDVLLVGDFNKWTPQPFVRDAKGRWTVSLELIKGDYSYSFVVDGKTIRDPYQRRTDAKGRSLLTVR